MPFSAATTTSPCSWEPYLSNGVKTQTTIHQNAVNRENKMGGQYVATSNEIMTPKTCLRTFKIYIEMYLLTYTNQLYMFG